MSSIADQSVQGVRTIDRAFRILAAFQSDDANLSLADLHLRLGLPKPTILRLANGLISCGALRLTDGRYQLGPKLLELSSLAHQHDRLARLALPFMGDLFSATQATIHFGVLDRGATVLVEKITGRRSVSVRSAPGMRGPAHCTGMGKVLLAFSPPESTEKVISTGLHRRTARTMVSPSLFRSALADVRRSGVAYDREELVDGVGCVAAPVFGPTGEIVGALSAVGHAQDKWLRQVTPAVRAAASGLTRCATANL